MLPREWTYTDRNNPGSIVVPAAAGLTPVMTSINARAGSFNFAPQTIPFIVLDSVTAIFGWTLLLADSTGPPISAAIDSFDSPITLIGTIGRSMTFQWQAAAGGPAPFEEVIITGYHF